LDAWCGVGVSLLAPQPEDFFVWSIFITALLRDFTQFVRLRMELTAYIDGSSSSLHSSSLPNSLSLDYCLKKILATSFYAGVELKVTKDTVNPSSSAFVLSTPHGTINKTNAILRYLAEITPAQALLGDNSYETSQVDQWLDYSWNEIEVRLQILLASPSSLGVTAEQKNVLVARVKNEFPESLSVLENHLESRTFLVNEKISLADISLGCTFSVLKSQNILTAASFPSLYRWYMTVTTQANMKKAFGTISTAVAASASSAGEYKWSRGRIRVKELLAQGEAAIGQSVSVKGWIRTSREGEKGKVLFVELTDGSTPRGLQLVVNSDKVANAAAVLNCGGVGASLSARGVVVSSPAKGQTVEIDVTEIDILGPVLGGENGEVGGKLYPMSKKQHSLEFLRDIAHLRPRSKVFSAALRVRHAMAFAIHSFFNERGFVYVHTPLITAADCEGAGEQFVVTTMLPEHGKVADIPKTSTGLIDYTKDFFSRRCCLTVSGQLNVETHACALSDVYTFGPTFRAENSHTSRHLAEFWMIEPEICFAELSDDMALAEDFIKYCTRYALEHCKDDLQYFEEQYPAGEKGLRSRLQNVVDNDFAKISYTEAIQLLQSDIANGTVVFENPVEWGCDLNSEHERYLSEKVLSALL
jgi:asparaginyl-tRNA synthetase